jgi:hypothetical protein
MEKLLKHKNIKCNEDELSKRELRVMKGIAKHWEKANLEDFANYLKNHFIICTENEKNISFAKTLKTTSPHLFDKLKNIINDHEDFKRNYCKQSNQSGPNQCGPAKSM